MKPQNLILIPVLIACLLAPKAQAVVPAPDGGYAGGNTGEGRLPFLALLPAHIIPPLVYFRSGATPRAAKIRLSELERFFSAPAMKIRLQALGRS